MRPAPLLVAALVGCAIAGVLAASGVIAFEAFWVATALVAVLALQDALQLRAQPTPTMTRDLPPVMPVGVERPVALHFQHRGRAPLVVEAHDLHPGDWPVSGLPRRVSLPPDRELVLPYRITPTQRGAFTFAGCQLRLASPLRLWRQRRTVPLTQRLRVYPNFAPLAKLALVGAEQASRVVGAHVKRRRGEGTEFQQLREYRVGDSMRQIDWKASQRARKLVSRDYQDERNQQVMLLLDTGRRMLARDGGLTHFDHVLNAALMVAYIALRQGDAVGLSASGGDARYMPPKRGLGTVDVLLNTVFDLAASPVATDYLEAATQLVTRQSRRCLVLLITNARGEDVDDLLAAVRLLQRRHLVCVASLREAVLDTTLATAAQSFDDAVRAGALAQYVEHRDAAHAALRAQGVSVLDVNCHELPAALVQHYLAIKRSARL